MTATKPTAGALQHDADCNWLRLQTALAKVTQP